MTRRGALQTIDTFRSEPNRQSIFLRYTFRLRGFSPVGRPEFEALIHPETKDQLAALVDGVARFSRSGPRGVFTHPLPPGMHWWHHGAPWSHLLQIARHAHQRRLIGETANDLDADGHAIAVKAERPADR